MNATQFKAQRSADRKARRIYLASCAMYAHREFTHRFESEPSKSAEVYRAERFANTGDSLLIANATRFARLAKFKWNKFLATSARLREAYWTIQREYAHLSPQNRALILKAAEPAIFAGATAAAALANINVVVHSGVRAAA